jgi:tape measure domain-containing protein
MDKQLELALKIKVDPGSGKAAIDGFSASVDRLGAAGARQAPGLRSLGQALTDAAGSSALLARGLGAVGAALSVGAIAGAARQYAQAAVEMERLKSIMEAGAGSALRAGQDYEFIRQTARSMGLAFTGAAEAFGKLSAASLGTALQGRATREVFTAVSRAAAALALSGEEVNGILLAVSQMMSKGVVSAEELRGQLGERLPGAFQVAARAMGVTTQKLGDMLQQGQVLAEDFLPKFAAELDKTFSGARFDRAGQEINRLTNEWERFKQSFVDTGFVAKAAATLAEELAKINAQLHPGEYLLNRRLNPNADSFGLSDPAARLKLREAQPADRLRGLNAAEVLRAGQSGPLAVQVGTVQTLELAVPERITTAAIETQLRAAAQKYGVPYALARAVAQTESGLSQYNKSGGVLTSSAGALGIMQLMPATAKGYGVDPTRADQNIEGGVRYLADLLKKYGDITKAVAAYNLGETKFDNRGLSNLPKETEQYIEKIRKAIGEAEIGKNFINLSDYTSNLKEAEALFKAGLDRQVADAENAGKKLSAVQATQLAGLDAWKARGETDRAQALVGLTGEERRRQERENLAAEAADLEEFARRRAEIEKAGLADQEAALRARLSAYQAEKARAGEFEASTLDRLKLDEQIKGAETELAVLAEKRRQIEIKAGADIAAARQKEAEALDQARLAALQTNQEAIQRAQDLASQRAQNLQAQVQAGMLTEGQMRKELSRIYDESARAIDGNVRELEKLAQSSRDPDIVLAAERAKGAWLEMVTAVRTPMQALLQQWRDTTSQMEQATVGWTEGFADALADMVMTGKADFKGLLDSIQHDLARVAAQRATASLLDVLGLGKPAGGGNGLADLWSGLGQLFSGGSRVRSAQSYDLGLDLDRLGGITREASYSVQDLTPEFKSLDRATQNLSSSAQAVTPDLESLSGSAARASASMLTLGQRADAAAANAITPNFGSVGAGGGWSSINWSDIATQAAPAIFGIVGRMIDPGLPNRPDWMKNSTAETGTQVIKTIADLLGNIPILAYLKLVPAAMDMQIKLAQSIWPDRKVTTEGFIASAIAGNPMPGMVMGKVVKSATGYQYNPGGSLREVAAYDQNGAPIEVLKGMGTALDKSLESFNRRLGITLSGFTAAFENRGGRMTITGYEPDSRQFYRSSNFRITDINVQGQLEQFALAILKRQSTLKQFDDFLLKGAIRASESLTDLNQKYKQVMKVRAFEGERSGMAGEIDKLWNRYNKAVDIVQEIAPGGKKRRAELDKLDLSLNRQFGVFVDQFQSNLDQFRGGSDFGIAKALRDIADQARDLTAANKELEAAAKRSKGKIQYTPVSSAAIEDARQQAIGNLQRQVIDQLRGLSGETEPLYLKLSSLRQQFAQVRAHAGELGISLQQVAEFEAQAVETLRTSLTKPILESMAAQAQAVIDQFRGPQSTRDRLTNDINTRMAGLGGLDPQAGYESAVKIMGLVEQRFQVELQNYQALLTAAQAIKGVVDGLKLSNLSPLNPEGRLKEAQGQYNTALLKAQAGDATALANLGGLAQSYLTEARSYYASSDQYVKIFQGVTASLDKIYGDTMNDPESGLRAIQKRTADLMDKLQAYLDRQDAAQQQRDQALQAAVAANATAIASAVAQGSRDIVLGVGKVERAIKNHLK